MELCPPVHAQRVDMKSMIGGDGSSRGAAQKGQYLSGHGVRTQSEVFGRVAQDRPTRRHEVVLATTVSYEHVRALVDLPAVVLDGEVYVGKRKVDPGDPPSVRGVHVELRNGGQVRQREQDAQSGLGRGLGERRRELERLLRLTHTSETSVCGQLVGHHLRRNTAGMLDGVGSDDGLEQWQLPEQIRDSAHEPEATHTTDRHSVARRQRSLSGANPRTVRYDGATADHHFEKRRPGREDVDAVQPEQAPVGDVRAFRQDPLNGATTGLEVRAR